VVARDLPRHFFAEARRSSCDQCVAVSKSKRSHGVSI
jgi:hypothetical protein